ncbi:MAG: STY4851/ECs_5259 family protein [Alcanivorax sp.]|nr:STY4851/ECs_5259 family protein [Alcanivorax sp.]
MGGEGGFSRFSDWKKSLLAAKGLEYPDGRSLYLYRLTDDQFNQLETLLHDCIERLVESFGLAEMARLRAFDSLFVLYAAEWWRRRYDGSGFNWEPILRDLGAGNHAWSPSERSKFVERGLRAWRIETHRSGALRFLGTVAVQGGLPLILLARARGGVGRLLSRVLRLARQEGVTRELIEGWVESLCDMLPKSYRRAEIYTLLADVVWTVLRLKKEANLQSSQDAIPVLDARVQGWRDRFPLPVDDKHAQGIIEQLIRDVADLAPMHRRQVLPIERYLDPLEGGGAALKSRLVLQPYLSVKELASLFSLGDDDNPRVAEISLLAGDQSFNASIRKLSGREQYRLHQQSWELAEEFACEEHTLQLTTPGGGAICVTAEKGEPLDEDLPWIFVDQASELRFIKQGSGSIAAERAWVALAAGSEVEPIGNTEVGEAFNLATFGRQVLEVRGEIRASLPGGLQFHLKTGQAGVQEESFSWRGDRVWLDFRKPVTAFRGMPELYRVDDEGVSRKVAGRAGVSAWGAAGQVGRIGPVLVRYPDHGDIEFRGKVLVLGQHANVRLLPVDARSGDILFDDWKADGARVTSEGVEQQCQQTEDGQIRLHVEVPAGQRAPAILDLEVFWRHTSQPAMLKVPFPARGARLLSASGKELGSDSLIALADIVGTRLMLVSALPGARYSLELSNRSSRMYRRYPLKSVPEGVAMELRLQDYLDDVYQLLSADDSPDSKVRVEIHANGQSEFSFDIARYSTGLEKNASSVGIPSTNRHERSLQDLSALGLNAVRLQSPEDEPSTLQPILTEGQHTGSWQFSPQEHEGGDWLIFPEGEAARFIRSTIWSMPVDPREISGLPAAVSLPDPEHRSAAILACLGEMALDFSHEGWRYVERLYTHVSELPLATLDIWRCFARSSQAMAALAIRLGNLPKDLVGRFSKELPFAWELVTASDWRCAFRLLQEQCRSSFPPDSVEGVFRIHVTDRVENLQTVCPALSYLLGIVSADYLPEQKKTADLLRIVIGHDAENVMFGGSDCLLMNFRRQHAERVDWPPDVINACESYDLTPLDEKYLHQFELEYQAWVANMPILLAVQVARGDTSYWRELASNIHAVKSGYAFDPFWFEEAFNQTIARCYTDGVLDEE